MQSWIFPSEVHGLTFSERNQFLSLPWRYGSINEVNGKPYAFFVIEGQISDSKGNIYSQSSAFLGVVPFISQREEKYTFTKSHKICYIETELLAEFFLLNIKALQSFLFFRENKADKILPEWQQFPRIRLVTSEETCWESIHLAMSLAHRQAQKNQKKSIYLECQSEGISVFQAVNKPAPVAIVQYNENEIENSLNELIKKRIIELDNRVDALNINFLSIWELENLQWAALCWQLKENYDEIIIHTGSKKIDYLYENSDVIFYFFTSSEKKSIYQYIHEKINLPPVIELFSNKVKISTEESFYRYPINLEKNKIENMDNILPDKIPSENIYWKWLSDISGHLLDAQKAVIVSESFYNPKGMTKLINYFFEKNQARESTMNEILHNNLFVFQGLSSISGFLASLNSSFQDIMLVLSRIQKKDIVSLLKPVFPVTGFFSAAPIEKYIKSLFGKILQQKTKSFLSVYSEHRNNIRWQTSGVLSENLLRGMFSFGLINYEKKTESNSTDKSFEYASNYSHYEKEAAYLARLGIKKADFYFFSDNTNSNENSIHKKLAYRLLFAHKYAHFNLQGENINNFIIYEDELKNSEKNNKEKSVDENTKITNTKSNL
ncbi:MAG: hypothetical protein OEZ22_10045 [Spirochaetia bacterium]|nr:hypothetical protein [Spirochaetia bacterium]